jgi:bifunctional enzyme Fae/Hps
MLDKNTRYLQVAFNYDAALVARLLPAIAKNERIIIEAGTPYIKREGMAGVKAIRRVWPGHLVADLKTLDGAYSEVLMAKQAGATAVTILGSAPIETLDIFIAACAGYGLASMIDMLGVMDPLKVVMNLKKPPDVVILHRGRDEETTRGKMIQYRHVNRLRSKFDFLISAAGGVDLKEARSAIFNGASIIVVNLVKPGDPWQGISTDSDVGAMTRQFLETIE